MRYINCMETRAVTAMPLPVMHALRKLGHDIALARKRRRITAAMMADRALTTRMTLDKVEKGDPTVSMAIYASVLFALGMTERLAGLAAPETDSLGQMLAEEAMPKRVRRQKRAEANRDE